ncbi:RNA polymerase II assembly factor like protein, partial [Tanacetum coccineum]
MQNVLRRHEVEKQSERIRRQYNRRPFEMFGGVSHSANGDENLLTANKITWEGVVTLLQLGKGLLSVKNISDIILSLISLAKGALSRAAQVWSSLINPVSEVEAERIFIQVKFYLNNADMIISHYPS